MRLAALSAAVGAALLIWAVVAVMEPEGRHVVRSNLTPPVAFVAKVGAGKELCQQGELLPAGSGALRLRAGTFGKPGPALEVTLQPGDGPERTGRIAAGWREGDILIPFPEAPQDDSGTRVCVRNAGSVPVVLAGAPATAGAARIEGGKAARGRVWLSYLRPAERSWWAATGAVAKRVGITRDALPGGWTLWLWLAATLGVAGGALALTVRAARR